MQLDEVVEYLSPLQYGRVHPLQAAHDFLPVPDLPVEAFHFVVVDLASEPDVCGVGRVVGPVSLSSRVGQLF